MPLNPAPMWGTEDWAALGITLRLAAWTTVILLLIGAPLAWWLARTRFVLRPLIQTLVAMPLVLPPTVLGFYILLLLGPGGPIQKLGGPALAFTFPGLVIGSVAYSLPFVVQPLEATFRSLDVRNLEAAATLGASPRDRFFTVALPLAWPGFLTAAVLGFAHTVGEFGVVLMIGGNIPGETRVVSIAIYDQVEMLNYGRAHTLSAVLLVMSFMLLFPLYLLNRRARPGVI